MRFFNTAGPVKCHKHYCLPPLERFDLENIVSLIEQEKYFVLHAPRQVGKTTYLLALMEHLNQSGQYHSLYINVEVGQSAREDVSQAMQAILGELAERAELILNDTFLMEQYDTLLHFGPAKALNTALTRWAKATSKPLVLLIDEIDSLVGDTLISVLRQLRAGYDKRPDLFPQSVILCGLRDVRDYRLHTNKTKAGITSGGGSPFNIKAESLRLGGFNQTEVETLYQQHTEETGQKFKKEALTLVWELTQGQPWLANALGYEVCFRTKANRDRNKLITTEMIEAAKERLIQRRETHLDQLLDKLKQGRVRRVMSPIIRGLDFDNTVQRDDIEYVMDLGLIKRTQMGLQIANLIYQEVIPRELSYTVQLNLESHIQPGWYIAENGQLDMNKIMAAFQQFFRQNSESWVERFEYKEAGPQLLMQAFLQRIVNSGGRLEREYGLGRARTDLLVIWPHPGGVQKAVAQQVVIELKIRYGKIEKTIAEGLKQTWKYMDKCGTTEGHLVIFDRDKKKPWQKKIFVRTEQYEGQLIKVWGM